MLHPCPACARHLREGTARCPFCDARVDPRSLAPSPVAPPGLSRAALLAFTALAAGGCSEAAAQTRDAGHGLGEPASAAAGYGAPPSNVPDAPTSHGTARLGAVVAVHPNDPALSATAARRVLEPSRPGVTLCYERALRTHPQLAGTLTVQIAVDAFGSVSAHPDVTGLAEDPALLSCVSERIYRLHFPSPHAASTVRATYTLQPPPR